MKRISINLLLTISALILIICMISGCTTVIRTEDPWVLVESDSFISDFLPGEENTTNAFGGLVGQETYDDFRFVAQGDWVYYHAPTRNIYKMPIDGSEGDQICLLTEEEFKMQIAENFPDFEGIIGYPGCLDLCVIGDWLYWASENGSIWKMRTDGEELTLLVRNRLPDSHHLRKLYYYYYGGRHFIIYKDWIYYTVLEGVQKDTTNYDFKSYIARTSSDGSSTEIISEKYDIISSKDAWPYELMGLCPDDEIIYVNASDYYLDWSEEEIYGNDLRRCILTYDTNSGNTSFINELPEYITENTVWRGKNSEAAWLIPTEIDGIIPGIDEIIPGKIFFSNSERGCANYFCWKKDNGFRVGMRERDNVVSDGIYLCDDGRISKGESEIKAVYGNTFFYVTPEGIRINDKLINADSLVEEICYAGGKKVYYANEQMPLVMGVYRMNIDGTEWEDVTWMVY